MDAVVEEIKAVPGMERYIATSMAAYLAMMTTSNYPGLSTFIDVVVGISVVIGFIVIFQAMYTAVMERTREIGILKAMGASKLYIVNVVLRETVLLALAASCGRGGESGGTGGPGAEVPTVAGGCGSADGSCARPLSRSRALWAGRYIRRSRPHRKTRLTLSLTNEGERASFSDLLSPLIPPVFRGYRTSIPRPKFFLANLGRMHDTAGETAML